MKMQFPYYDDKKHLEAVIRKMVVDGQDPNCQLHFVIVSCLEYLGYLIRIWPFQNFLRDLLREAKKSQEVSEDELIQYTDTMLQVFDSNKDGKLQLSEMAK